MQPRTLGLLTLATVYFTLGTASLAVVGLLEPMSRGLRAAPAGIAQLVTVFALTYALAAPFFQVCLSGRSRRGLLLLGIAALGLGCLAAALAPTLGWAVAARVLMALGAAAAGPMASTLAAGMVEVGEQARALALVFGGMILSTVLGVPLATWAGRVLSWRGVFLALAGLALACLPAAGRFVREGRPGAPASISAMGRMLADRRTSASILCMLLQSAGQFASYTLIAALLTGRFAVPAAQLSLALLLFGVGGVMGNVLGGRLGDRGSALALVWVAILGLLAVFLAMTLAPARPGIGLALLGAWAVLAMLFQAPQQKRLLGFAPDQPGLVLALNSSALYIGMSLGAWSGAQVFQRWGVEPMPAASALLVALSAIALWFSSGPARGRPA